MPCIGGRGTLCGTVRVGVGLTVSTLLSRTAGPCSPAVRLASSDYGYPIRITIIRRRDVALNLG
jgi:hypothetical protein